MLFALELVSAMAVADGNGERVAASFFNEFDGFFRVRVVTAGGVRAPLFALRTGLRAGALVLVAVLAIPTPDRSVCE